MKKYLIYRPDGTVLTISNGKNKVAKLLACKEFTIDKTKEEQNWTRKIVNKKLVYEKPPQIEKEEKKQAIESKKQELKNATTLEQVKKVQEDIIDLI
jgi:hypothetical protein|tara:strand:- start:37 stop:327 length:291 start_codon:yes stop_codon:yes gene_type:complete